MKYLKFIIPVMLVALTLGFFTFAKANPTFLASNCIVQTSGTSTATTTVSFMTPGVGTTTLNYDSSCSGNNQITDKASLLVYQSASSTNSGLDITVEYSNNNTDWYQNKLDAVAATTTVPVSIGTVSNFFWTYASSTPGKGVVPATINYDSRIISLYTPTRYMRVIFSNHTLTSGAGVATSFNTAVWAQIIPNKEKP